ncbi:hypothetical protein Tco_1455151, partial [Tanacetum coccineum]
CVDLSILATTLNKVEISIFKGIDRDKESVISKEG